jgi:hypothetical protein
MKPRADRAARTLLASLFLLALCAACGLGSADLDATGISEVRGMVDCEVHPFECGALDRFRSGQAPATTATPYSLVGRGYSTGFHRTEVYWFVARGEAMRSGNVLATNAEEPQQLAQALNLLSAGQSLPPTHPVAVYVASLATGGDPPYETEVRGRSRYYRDDDSRDVFIRQVGSEIIVVRRERTNAVIEVYRRP